MVMSSYPLICSPPLQHYPSNKTAIDSSSKTRTTYLNPSQQVIKCLVLCYQISITIPLHHDDDDHDDSSPPPPPPPLPNKITLPSLKPTTEMSSSWLSGGVAIRMVMIMVFLVVVIEGEKETRPITDDVKEVMVTGPLDVTITQGNTSSLVVEASPTILPHVTTSVHGAELDIGLEGNINNYNGKLAANVVLPTLQKVGYEDGIWEK